MDEPAFAGCMLSCRPIGIIEGEQSDEKRKERNDRIVTVERDAHSWRTSRRSTIWASNSPVDWKSCFVDYHKLTGK